MNKSRSNHMSKRDLTKVSKHKKSTKKLINNLIDYKKRSQHKSNSKIRKTKKKFDENFIDQA